jgi:GDPmannose 4,6-dehydratase
LLFLCAEPSINARTYRRLSTPNFWRLEYLKVFDKVSLFPVDLNDAGSITKALKISVAGEVYYLAAQSFVGASFETPVTTGDITGLAATRLLESIRNSGKNSKFYFAATSEMFGQTSISMNRSLKEGDFFSPMSILNSYFKSIVRSVHN